MVERAALQGYLLEELLAQLLQDAGYGLLSSKDADDDVLRVRGNGLQIRGRGCYHQADALGALSTPVPFGLPLRLFVEAKYRGKEVGITAARNAHGVIYDVNQYVSSRSRQRFCYQYALISTSGFTPDAEDFADAHGITLHDFSGKAWELLRTTVERAAEALMPLIATDTMPGVPLSTVRLLLRAALGTSDGQSAPASQPPSPARDAEQRVRAAAKQLPTRVPAPLLRRLIPPLVEVAQRQDRALLIGYPDNRMMLALRPDDPHALDAYFDTAIRRQVAEGSAEVAVPVAVAFDRDAAQPGNVGDWVIYPQDDPTAFRLRVGIPPRAEHRLLTTNGDADAGIQAGSIVVYRAGRTIRLVFQLAPADALVLGEPFKGRPLRARRASATVAIPRSAQLPLTPVTTEETGEPAIADVDNVPQPRDALPDEESVDTDGRAHDGRNMARWTHEEIWAMVHTLENEPKKRRVAAQRALTLLFAAVRAGGTLDRMAVYREFGTELTTRFNGNHRTFSSLRRRLQENGQVLWLRAEAVETVYDNTGRERGQASGITVRPEFVEVLQRKAREWAAKQSTGRLPTQRGGGRHISGR